MLPSRSFRLPSHGLGSSLLGPLPTPLHRAILGLDDEPSGRARARGAACVHHFRSSGELRCGVVGSAGGFGVVGVGTGVGCAAGGDTLNDEVPIGLATPGANGAMRVERRADSMHSLVWWFG